MSDPRQRIAILVLAAASGVFVWWGWKQGAYFGSVFYPGAIVLWLLLAMLLALAPFSGRIRGPALLALAALTALAAWALLSAIWSPSPAAAVRYGMHGLLYAALFALGLWGANLMRSKMVWALAPVSVATVAVGAATVVVLAGGHDVTWYFHEDATLRFPFGYRNANAAFFMIGLWPLAASIAATRSWKWRAPMLGAATLLLELAFLCQSRGSVPAAAIAVVVYLAVSPNRLRAAVVLGLALAPMLVAVPTLLDVYRHGEADPALVPLMRDAAKAIVATSVLSALLGAVAYGSIEPRLRLGPRATAAIARVATAAALLVVVVAGSVFVIHHGGPVSFADQRLKEFKKVGYPDLHGQGIRYGANVGSNRHDFWRVAIDEGLDHPLLGRGAGSFEVGYLQHRRSEERPEDPHSVEALMLSELGLPGILLLLAFLVAATAAILRSRRLGTAAAGLSAGALAAGAQWVTQASFDWIWNYPGVTGPAIFLLGAASAPALLDSGRERGFRRRRLAPLALVVLLSLVAVPLFLSARFSQLAYGDSRSDPARAVADLERASDLNPLDAEPALAKAAIEAGQGETEAAIADLHTALDREPDNFEANLLLARELAPTDLPAARASLARARELNPTDPAVEEPLSGR